jgi:hypothetical protein
VHRPKGALVLMLLVAPVCWTTGQPTSRPAAGGGYLGMSLPADFVAFPNSVWTTPIEVRPAVDPDSAGQIALLRAAPTQRLERKAVLAINTVKWSAPIHVVDGSVCPRVNVPCDAALPRSLDRNQDRVAENIPVPDEIWADPSEDSHVVIVDLPARVAYEFWHWRKTGNRSYRAGMAGKWDLSGPGFNTQESDEFFRRNGATASRAPYIAGVIRPEELARGEIRHALHMVIPTTRANAFRAPAVNSDGRNGGSDYIPAGARLQLNPDLNLDSLGLSPPTRVIARALQVYGAFIMDTASGWAIKAQNFGPDGGPWRQYARQLNLDAIPIEEFRILK